MANEERKDFNAMLHDSKDMPKLQIVTDEKTIAKYGGDRMYFAPPLDYDRVMKRIPPGKLTTVGAIREHFARENDRADHSGDFCLNRCLGESSARG